MNKTTAIAASVIIVGGTVVVAAKQWNSLIADLEGRFPDIDPKIIRKAYRKFMTNSFLQKYDNIENLSDEQMDLLFLVEVTKVTAK